MKSQSGRAGHKKHREEFGNEHLGYNEARYAGQAYNHDHNQNKNEWRDNEGRNNNQYRHNNEPGYHPRPQQGNNSRAQSNNSGRGNNPAYNDNYRNNRNTYPQEQNHFGRETDYRDWNDDINADRSIQGSRNYMREEHAYGQSNDSMYEENRGNRQSRQNYQDDYNYNNNAQYPHRNDLDAYDTNFDTPENLRKQRRRGFGSRYER